MTRTTLRASMLALTMMAGGAAISGGANAETMKECSLKYQAAKKAGTLNGADWKSFRAAQCSGATPMAATDTDSASAGPGKAATPEAGASAATAAAPASASGAAVATPQPTTTATQATSAGPGKSGITPPVVSGNVVFPAAVDPKYARLTAGKGRMKTCVDQYKANKAGGGNGGLKWIQKGGGYYSLCSRKLKGG